MSPHPALVAPSPRDHSALRTLADLALSRAAGAPLIGGNQVRVLRDGTENYPAWEEAIRNAQRTIHLEMYTVHPDRVGRRFVRLLSDKAREGVTVRVLYDWFGCGWAPLFGLFRPLIHAGAEVRCFNPPSPTATLGWIRRNHRKLINIDSRVASVAGLCLGAAVTGNRRLEDFEFAPLLTFGALLTVIAASAFWYPRALAWPLALLAGWTGISFITEAVSLWRHRDTR